jgi:transposase-like protein
MGKKCNQYTKEHKIDAVRLIGEEGRPISEVARELGTAFIASLEKEV